MSRVRHIPADFREIRVSQASAYSFSTSEGWAFSLVQGLIVGKKNSGREKAYAVPFMDVMREHAKNANKQECEMVIRTYSERLKEVA